MNCGKSSNCLDRRMKIIILEKRSAECGIDGACPDIAKDKSHGLDHLRNGGIVFQHPFITCRLK